MHLSEPVRHEHAVVRGAIVTAVGVALEQPSIR